MKGSPNIYSAMTALWLAALSLTACRPAAEPVAPSPEPWQPEATFATAAQTASILDEPTAQRPEPSATLDGQALVAQRCSVCHSLTRIQQSSKNEAQWEATVARMIGKGAKLSPQERAAVVQYLAQTYGR